ncbi:DUF1918 domain-containing protein [Agrococcus carbonis]|jgi:hypothetical protein|uniref:DUF1918 domain-containing protein n=1 Tax=Agrococcus carbonis TaxID=684552 RepID=A0A1H1S349_9MICO|nr:DUF1918 domain-containing protein [Agrococcus carbonis]SDS42435.1 protein of unknown function [Agrococcus carbonis]
MREVVAMQAKAGDRVVVEGSAVDKPRREGEVLEARGEGGGPPFFVRWEDGHEGLLFPGPDAHVISGG